MSKKRTRSSILSMTAGAAAAALPPQATTAKQGSLVAPMAIIFALTVVLMQSAQAQGSYTVLHHFSGGLDGAGPLAGLTMDPSGNLYGTTYYGGTTGYGVAFKLKRNGSGYSFKVIHDFGDPYSGTDGGSPDSKLTIGPDGGLYGVTNIGGKFFYGTVFNLNLPSYNESLPYQFPGGKRGDTPTQRRPSSTRMAICLALHPVMLVTALFTS